MEDKTYTELLTEVKETITNLTNMVDILIARCRQLESDLTASQDSYRKAVQVIQDKKAYILQLEESIEMIDKQTSGN